MKKITVTIDGKEYPCRATMGAMLRFKRETGKEVTEIDGTSLTDLCAYLYCCIASASKHDGVEFSVPLLDFADGVTPADLAAWAEAIGQEAGGETAGNADTQKKMPR